MRFQEMAANNSTRINQ